MNIFRGVISVWSGSIATIPKGWRLCDGNAGTPDLRDRYIANAGVLFAPLVQGGNPSHTHPAWANPHSHELLAYPHYVAGSVYSKVTETADPDVTVLSCDNVPPYIALCIIMKL